MLRTVIHSLLLALVIGAVPRLAMAAIAVNPNGVNVNSQGATTVFLTYGGLVGQVPVEAFWCGELLPAAPAIGSKCNPATIFGSLPIRYDQSQSSGTSGFTDIMSIPASVSRRAYQAAESGAASSFFYVRRFVRSAGGPDEYVVVTCRMAGGGARVPLALVDVSLKLISDATVLFVKPGTSVPAFNAAITYTGTGRLKGRWEVVLPGDELPAPDDLLTEATLPVERRGLQRRYTQVERFNVFLPPTGRVTLAGPDATKLPTGAEGAYMVLLRVEVSDDKEGDSDLAVAGAGSGTVHSGAVAGFPMPTLRYVVGNGETIGTVPSGLELLVPADDVTVDPTKPVEFSWSEIRQAAVYRLEIQDAQGKLVHAALVQTGIGAYRAPSWLKEKAGGGALRWRVVALDVEGRAIRASAWRVLKLGEATGPVDWNGDR